MEDLRDRYRAWFIGRVRSPDEAFDVNDVPMTRD